MYTRKLVLICSILRDVLAQIFHHKEKIEKCSEKLAKETKILKNSLKLLEKSLPLDSRFILAFNDIKNKFMVETSPEMWPYRIYSICDLLRSDQTEIVADVTVYQILAVSVAVDMTIEMKECSPIVKETLFLYKQQLLSAGAVSRVNKDSLKFYMEQLLEDSTKLFSIRCSEKNSIF